VGCEKYRLENLPINSTCKLRYSGEKALLAGRKKGEESLAAGGGNEPGRFLEPGMASWSSCDFAVGSTAESSKT
jgi:hypothetical protein